MISNDDSTPLAEHDKTSLQYLPVMCDAVVKVNFLFVPPVNRPRYLDNGIFFAKPAPSRKKRCNIAIVPKRANADSKTKKKTTTKEHVGFKSK